MDFSTLSYRNRNRVLWGSSGLVLLLCWFLSFSKTYEEFQEYQRLNNKAVTAEQSPPDVYSMEQRMLLQDSILNRFQIDSVSFEDSFLQHVSLCLDQSSVQITYEGKGVSAENISKSVLAKEVILQGSYQEIVDAVYRLEKEFFLRRLVYEKGKYKLELSCFSKQPNKDQL